MLFSSNALVRRVTCSLRESEILLFKEIRGIEKATQSHTNHTPILKTENVRVFMEVSPTTYFYFLIFF